MLTTLVEQGRVKCHQYWPPPGESRLHGQLRVTTASQEITDSFAFREVTLVSEDVSWRDSDVGEGVRVGRREVGDGC